jgi:hypothetical protein
VNASPRSGVGTRILKAVVGRLPAAASSLPEDHLVMDIEVRVLFLVPRRAAPEVSRGTIDFS